MFIRKIWKYKSTFALILANLYTLYGVMFLGWRSEEILIIYWAESGIIGFYTLNKMILSKASEAIKIFYALFFVVHFSGFMFGHYEAIFALLKKGGLVGHQFDLLNGLLTNTGLLISVLVLFVSHGISFAINYIGKKEYLRLDPRKALFSPYPRIMLMQLTVYFGSALCLEAPGSPIFVFVFLKIIFDLNAHWKEHGQLS